MNDIPKSEKRFLDFDPKNLAADIGAGITVGLVAIPDSIASAILAGVNPIYAFNAIMVGLPVGSLFTSSQFLNLTQTGAMMLILASVVKSTSPEMLVPTLVIITLLVGVIEVLFGVLKLGKLTRFISNAVMTGFFTGIAAIIVLSQIGPLTGYYSQVNGGYVAQTIDILLHPAAVLQTWPALALGIFTFILILLIDRTRLANFSLIIAIVIASVAAYVLRMDVQLIRDTFEIQGKMPTPAISELMQGISLIPKLILPALALSLIGLIQAAGISQSIPNPDGEYPDVSGDFIGQGVANLASGLFRGLPLGGSLGGTAVNMAAGARSRWANIFGGLFVIPLVLLLGNFVGAIADPAIAALLIVAGVQTINRERISDVWNVGKAPRLIMVFTFIATLLLPIQWAVFLGVALSFLVHVIDAAGDVRVNQLLPRPDGLFEERPAPEKLESEQMVILQLLGSIFFSAAYKLQEDLPDPDEARRPVVILRLRGHERIGSTFLSVLEKYANELRKQDGKLILSGVNEGILEQLEKTGSFGDVLPREDVFLATDVLGESTRQAMAAAQQWLAEENPTVSEAENTD